MSDSRARVLTEADWQLVRDLRLEALRESPDSFVASHDDESQRDEEFWRERTRRATWIVAERDGKARGIVGLGPHSEDPDDSENAEIFGLWVSPQTRRNRVGQDLVRAGVEQAVADDRRRLYFWVGSDNGPAVAFASANGFRPTSERRPTTAADHVDGGEVAMVMSLDADPTSVVNPQLR